MISQEDYNFIVAFDINDSQKKEALLKRDRHQAAQTLLNLLGHVSRDQTLQYILVLIDDMLQVRFPWSCILEIIYYYLINCRKIVPEWKSSTNMLMQRRSQCGLRF